MSVLGVPEDGRVGSSHPAGCLDLAASRAEPVPDPEAEAEAPGSRARPASDSSAALSGRTQPLCPEAAGTSGTGGSSLVALVRPGDKVVSSEATAAPAASSGVDEGDSPLTEKEN